VYEHPAWETMPDHAMRPGRLEVTESALDCSNLPTGGRVLDVGCGAGATLSYLLAGPDRLIYGIDISRVLLKNARLVAPGARLALAHAEQMPLADGCMDAVISECTFSLFEIKLALGEFIRVLRNGGYLIVSDIYARNKDGLAFLRRLPPETCLGGAQSRDEIEAAIQGRGFIIETWQDSSDLLEASLTCTLAKAAQIDPFDLIIAAARAKIGYYFLVARKVEHGFR
jgi:SAM-dependent methyltransferase